MIMTNDTNDNNDNNNIDARVRAPLGTALRPAAGRGPPCNRKGIRNR